MQPLANTGTRLWVCKTLPTTYDQAGYEALTFTQIRGVRVAGSVSRRHKTSTNNPTDGLVPSNRRVGAETSALPLDLIRLQGDAGQEILKDAVNDPASYAYKIQQPDGLTLYFTAEAINLTLGLGDSKGLSDIQMTLEIDSQILEI